MKLFSIYIKKSPHQPIDDLVAIKNGFSFFAFLFNILWFLQHKMWRESLALVLFNIIFGLITQKNWLGGVDIITIEFVLIIMLGLNANYWYEQSLLRKNYQFSGCVYGKNDDEAKLRFISDCFDSDNKNNILYRSICNFKKDKESQEYLSV